jgi:hypothetical protein
MQAPFLENNHTERKYPQFGGLTNVMDVCSVAMKHEINSLRMPPYWKVETL